MLRRKGKRMPDKKNDPPDIVMRHGAYLPHWTRARATYAVTFRLADSLPQAVLAAWRQEREEIIELAEKQGRPLSFSEQESLRVLQSEKVETYLDAGCGACSLREPQVAEAVEAALRHFDGEHYRLHAWCVMPNHVHTVIEPAEAYELSGIIHSWKSFTAKSANRILARTGIFWQAEYYDHIIRDEAEFAHALRYIEENPQRAGLKEWPWVYVARASCR